MCNGSSARTSEGGVIVVLKDLTAVPTRPLLQRELSMRLVDDEALGKTTAWIDGIDNQAVDSLIIQ